MFRLLRHTRGPALLALVIIGGSVPMSIAALVHDADDTACQPVLVQHDESAHRVGAARTLARFPQHCAVCHWLQSLQTTVASSAFTLPTAVVAHLHSSPLIVFVVQALGEVPARAPPLA